VRREEKVAAALDQAGVEIGVGKGRAGHQARKKVDVGADPDDAVVGQRLPHARQRGMAVDVPDDQLGDHRVVIRRDLVALLDAGIDADVETLGRARQMQQATGRRQKIVLGFSA
jgi:hypothetical protein